MKVLLYANIRKLSLLGSGAAGKIEEIFSYCGDLLSDFKVNSEGVLSLYKRSRTLPMIKNGNLRLVKEILSQFVPSYDYAVYLNLIENEKVRPLFDFSSEFRNFLNVNYVKISPISALLNQDAKDNLEKTMGRYVFSEEKKSERKTERKVEAVFMDRESEAQFRRLRFSEGFER